MYEITTHNFEAAKNSIKVFSEQAEKDISLSKVNYSKDWKETLFGGGPIWDRDHKVTGAELNNLTSKIQDRLIELNDEQIKSIKELGQVYNALEALDKDYIQAIVGNLKAVEATSEKIQKEHVRINKVVEDEKKTLEILKLFKDRLDNFDHLYDIDSLWDKISCIEEEIPVVSNLVKSALLSSDKNKEDINLLSSVQKDIGEEYKSLKSKVDNCIEQMETIIGLTQKVQHIEHLDDIDDMWACLSDISGKIRTVVNDFEEQQDKISKQENKVSILKNEFNDLQQITRNLREYFDQLRQFEHLREIDEIWGVEQYNSEQLQVLNKYRDKLDTYVHLGDIDSLWNISQNNLEEIAVLKVSSNDMTQDIENVKEEYTSLIKKIREDNSVQNNDLLRKIKIGYMIAGGAFGIAIIELLILLSGII